MNYKVLKEMPRAKVGDVLHYGGYNCLHNKDTSSIVLFGSLINDAISEGFITPIDEEVVKTELPGKFHANFGNSEEDNILARIVNQLISYLKERE